MTDVRDPDQVDAALARTIDELGPVAILVNNAGGVFASSLLDTAPKGWDALLRPNLGHVLLCTHGSPGRWSSTGRAAASST